MKITHKNAHVDTGVRRSLGGGSKFEKFHVCKWEPIYASVEVVRDEDGLQSRKYAPYEQDVELRNRNKQFGYVLTFYSNAIMFCALFE